MEKIKLRVRDVLKHLEDSGEIVLTTATPNVVVNKVVEALNPDIYNFLSDVEFRAVLNSLNVLVHDVRLDSRDFQTIIGIEKNELKTVLDKLSRTS